MTHLAHRHRDRSTGKGASNVRRERSVDKLSYLAVGLFAGLLTSLFQQPRAGGQDPHWTGVERSRDIASSPAEIPPRGWRAVLQRTLKEFNHDHIPAVAAGATFYSLLALFPALGVFVSLFGLFGDIAKARSQIVDLQGFLPEGGVRVLTEQIDRLAAAPAHNLGLTFVVSLLLSVWSSNAGMKALIAGLNVAYEQEEQRKFVALNLQSLAFTAAAIALAILGTMAIGATPSLLHALHLESLRALSLLRWPLLLVAIVTLISLLYRYGPSARRTRWRWITPGGVFAGVGWVAMSAAFSVYVNNFGNYDKTYGSLGAVVGFMTWIWLTLTVILAGAELNCELERQVASGERPPSSGGRTGARR
jgi:membrane protein